MKSCAITVGMKHNSLFFGGLLLLAAALCLTLWNLEESRAAETAARQTLTVLETPQPEIQQAKMPAPEAEMPTKEIDGNLYVGTLEIPALEVKLPVISEWDYTRLKIAPCRYKGSAYRGDLIIAAHNYQSHFGGLHRLKAGDSVIFTDAAGNRFTYAVSQTEQLSGAAIEEMEAGDWDLTLFTCTVGGAARVTVRCALSEPPA